MQANIVYPYLAYDIRVVVGDEAEAPGPAGLLVIHHNSVFHFSVPMQQKHRVHSISLRHLVQTSLVLIQYIYRLKYNDGKTLNSTRPAGFNT